MKNMKNNILALLVLSEKKFNDDLGMSVKWLQTLATAPQPDQVKLVFTNMSVCDETRQQYVKLFTKS